MPGHRNSQMRASATVESAILIPLATVIILVCLKMNISAYNHVAAESAGMRGALLIELEEPDTGERLETEQRIKKTVAGSTLMLSDPEVEIIEDSHSTGIRITAEDPWKIPFLGTQEKFDRAEQFSFRSPADFIRLVHTISNQISTVSGENEDGVHD